MIYEVCFHANVSGKQVSEKVFGKLRFLTEDCEHRLHCHPKNGCPLDCACGGRATRLASQTALAEETSFRQDGNLCGLAAPGGGGELHIAALDVEHRIRRIPEQGHT
jgi:hypothetical protein